MGPGNLGHYTFLYRKNAFGVKNRLLLAKSEESEKKIMEK